MSATYLCDCCKTELQLGYGSPFIGPIKFSVDSFDDKGPNDSTRKCVYRFTLSEARPTWNFDSTNVHFCPLCMLKGFAVGVADRIAEMEQDKKE